MNMRKYWAAGAALVNLNLFARPRKMADGERRGPTLHALGAEPAHSAQIRGRPRAGRVPARERRRARQAALRFASAKSQFASCSRKVWTYLARAFR